VLQSNGTAERDAALIMPEKLPGRHPVTVGGDKGFDTRDFREGVPQSGGNAACGAKSCAAGRQRDRWSHYWHPGYVVSQRKRKRIEECFGWLKTIALMRKVRHRGVCKMHWIFTFACAAYNLVRMRNLAAPVRAV
jgi:hypothetical protein